MKHYPASTSTVCTARPHEPPLHIGMALNTASSALIVFLSSLALPPRPNLVTNLHPRTLAWPLTLLLHPVSSLAHLSPSSLRTIAIARSVEHYVLAWALLGLLNALIRLGSRLSARIFPGMWESGKGGLETRLILGARPMLNAILWHLVAWRLVILPTASAGAVALGRGWDVAASVGVIGGLAASWSELWTLLALFGLGKGELTILLIP